LDKKFNLKESIRSRNEKLYAFFLLSPIAFILHEQPTEISLDYYASPITEEQELEYLNSLPVK